MKLLYIVGMFGSLCAGCVAGRLLTAIARKLLHLPIGRFVDDLFAPESVHNVEHAMECVARLVEPVCISEFPLEFCVVKVSQVPAGRWGDK